MKFAEKPAIISRQVNGARYYFLNMNPVRESEIVVVCGGVECCNPDYSMRRQTFEYFGIEFVAEGEGSLELGGKKYELVPGTVFSYGPEMICAISNNPDKPMLKYFIDFVGENGRQLLRSGPLGIGNVVRVAAGADLSALFEQLQHEGSRDTIFTPGICAALLRVLVLKIAESSMLGGHAAIAAQESFARCKEYIDRHGLDLESLDQVARATRMDASYICRLFRRFHRQSPYQYITRLKMRCAADLLVGSKMLIKQVAAEVGFEDQYHFSRVFKSVYGVSPRRFMQLQ
jgi:AraC-like DNA-binding protein